MVEQSHSRKCHSDAILVACHDYMVITDGSAGFSDILNAALVCTLNVIAEGEKCITANGHAANGGQIRRLLFFRKGVGLHREI